MNGRLLATLMATGAMVLFASSAPDRATAQSSSRQTELNAAKVQDDRQDSRQDNGQQGGQPQSSDYPRRDDTRRSDEDRDRSGDRRSDVPAEGERVTLPPDSIISVRIADEISSNKNHTGDIFTGIVDPSVLIHNQVVIPRGTEAHVRMAEDKKGGHIHGKAEVHLELVSLVVNGRRLGVESDPEVRGQGAMSAKAKAAEKSGEHAGGSATGVAGPAGSAAGPVIAAFAAPKVEMKANSRVEFILAEPFTFARPPVNDVPPAQ
jgi:hypothetical protein